MGSRDLGIPCQARPFWEQGRPRRTGAGGSIDNPWPPPYGLIDRQSEGWTDGPVRRRPPDPSGLPVAIESPRFAPVDRRTLPAEVRDRLVQAIRSGQLPPGAQLPSERVLCEDFGVARASVREPLQGLLF